MHLPARGVRRLLVLGTALTLAGTAAATSPSAAEVDETHSAGHVRSDAVVFEPATTDQRRTASDRAAVDHAPADARRTDATTAAADAGNVIDIAFVYPAALVSQADIGGLAGLRAKFNHEIADTNQAFTNSGIPVQLRYVGDRQVAAPTSTNVFAMLRNLGTPGDGVYDEAQQLREETHADLVSLWASGSVPLGDACGIGSLGGSRPQTDPDYSAWTMMFYTDCVDRFRVFAHEVGHNLSGDHDVAAASPPSSDKPYARGYTDPSRGFMTVMSYYEACNAARVSCTRAPYFSSPTGRTADGLPTGNATTDNVRAVTEQAPAVANYRQSQIYPAAPVITGRANRGKTLTATTPGWAPGNLTFSYQWTADGAPIPGATSQKLKLGKSHLGKTIAVTVVGSGPYYAPVAAGSAATSPVGKKLFKKTQRPRIRGAARPGSRLGVAMKAWKPSKKVRYRYQWLRNGDRIKGAKGRTYRVKRKDRGKKISVRVTGKRRGYEAQSRTSRKVKVRR